MNALRLLAYWLDIHVLGGAVLHWRTRHPSAKKVAAVKQLFSH